MSGVQYEVADAYYTLSISISKMYFQVYSQGVYATSKFVKIRQLFTYIFLTIKNYKGNNIQHLKRALGPIIV